MKLALQWAGAILVAAGLPLILVVTLATSLLSVKRDALQESAERYARILGISQYKLPDSNVQDSVSPLLLGSSDTTVTLAELQSKLRNLAAQRAMQITQANQVEGEKTFAEEGSLSKVMIHLEFSGKMESVAGFFSDIEQSQPWLFLERVSILSSDQEGMPQIEEPLLYVSADIWGAVPREAASGP